jgi:Zn-dependent protease/predicted transcriptional regulator
MKWSLRIGRYAGIDVYLHVTFLLLVGLMAFLFWQEGRTLAAAAKGVGFYLSIFACVLMHEYGHALTARRYGIRTRDITLLPIGGVARLERLPEKPMQEFWVAVAGPAVNVVIAAVILLALLAGGGGSSIADLAWKFYVSSISPLIGQVTPETQAALLRTTFLERIMFVNLFLVGFNLLPAFPMDGGRVLRSLLALRMDFARATQVAAGIGQFMALGFGFVGVAKGMPTLFIIAFFVWFGASQETGLAQVRSVIGGLPVSRAMLTEFHVLSPFEPLSRAVEFTLAGWQQDFPVVHDEAVVGILTRADLMTALAQRGLQTPVGEEMQTDFPVAVPGESLEAAFARLQDAPGECLPVLEHGKIVGLLTSGNVGEFVMIHTAIRRSRPKPPIISRRA